MDNNEIPTTGGTPNPSQPIDQSPNQTASQPPFQQAPQPIQSQPFAQPITGIPDNNQGSKKKLGIIIGCSIGALAVIALVAVLLIMLLGHGGKTVTCTMDTTTMGIDINGETNVNVKDNEISGGNIIVSVNLKTMQDFYKDYEKELVDQLTDTYKNRCNDHCTFDYKYAEGDNVKYTMQYDKDGVDEIVWNYGTEGMSAQEIADEVQESLESSGMTCTQR